VPVPASYALFVPFASAAITYTLIAWMLGPHGLRLPLDSPNERSLHSVPIPRVGGVAIVATVLAAGLALGASPVLLATTLVLAGVSFLDDRGGLPARARLVIHALAAAVWLWVELAATPFWLLALFFLAIVWVTNLYNFMDGMDGLAGGMALFGFAAYALAFWLGGNTAAALLSASVAAASAVFLRFNFHPARVFMGDAGSIPLGFLAVTLGLEGWRDGTWPLWFPLVVFSPFIVDASATLAQRVARKETFWRPHRTHYYQRLVQLGWGHRNTALAEYALMAGCGVTALWALGQPPTVQWVALAAISLVYVALTAAVDAAWRRHARTLDARPS